MPDQTRVSLVLRAWAAPACELCTSDRGVPTASVVVQHARGGTVQLAACDWCVQAIRRVAAATGGHAQFALSETPAALLPQPPRGPSVPPQPPRGSAVLPQPPRAAPAPAQPAHRAN